MIRSKPFRRLAASLLPAAVLLSAGAVFAAGEEVVMYKDPNCGCCTKWADHLRENGFQVREIDSADMRMIKAEAGLPAPLASCHTATVEGYVVEGHVPASSLRRLLDERPPLAGIAVPGMPLGSPGMEGPYPADRYDVIGFDRQGRTEVFSSY